MTRLRRNLKRLAIIIGLLAAFILIANAIAVWRTGAALERRLIALRQAGQPLTLAELGSAPAEGTDAGPILKRIEPELKVVMKEMAAATTDRDGNRDLNDEEWKVIEKAINGHPTVLAGIQEAAAAATFKPTVNFQLSTQAFLAELLTCVQVNREVANVLKYAAQLRLRQGDRDGAISECIALLRFARLTERKPMIISHLMSIAIRSIALSTANEVLQTGKISKDRQQELDSELAKVDHVESLKESLRSERPFGLQAIDELDRGGWFSRAIANDQKSHYLDSMAAWIERADLPFAQFQNQSGRPSAGWYSLTNLIIPAVDKVTEAHFRMRCQVRTIRVLNALVARGDASARLADLGLDAKTIQDPFTDQPLLVKRKGNHWVVYGVGVNLADDGGSFDANADVGYGPPK